MNNTNIWKKLSFYFYVFYCFEIGIFLVVVPWWLPHVWENNFFYFQLPALKTLFHNGFFRGAVTGLGLLNVVLAILEVLENERAKNAASRAEPAASNLRTPQPRL